MTTPVPIQKLSVWPGSFIGNALYLVKDGNFLEVGMSSIDGQTIYKIIAIGDVVDYINSVKNANNGLAALDGDGKVLASVIPVSGVTVESANQLSTPRTITIGATGKNFDGNSDLNWTLVDIGAISTTLINALNGVAGLNAVGQISASAVPTSGVTVEFAQKLATARTINGVAFDGSGNITINAVDSTDRIASSEKGAVNGVATLDATGKVPTAQLPSYVDDVIEVANFAALPGTGEAGKIYITLDDNKTYRWSGSAYVNITASPGSTDSITEGSTNLYFTEGRVRSTLLDGLNITVGGVISSTDSVLGSLGKLQKQTTDHSSNSSNPHSTTAAQVGAPTIAGVGATGTWSIGITGNAGSATVLATPRSINGTNFDGSANITTANWGNSRTLTIGSTGKSVNGGVDVSWSLAEIGAAATGHTHNYAGSASAGGPAASVAGYNIIKFDTGSTENTDLYTFNGSSSKTIDIKAGSNVSITKAPGTITISANDTSIGWSEITSKPTTLSGYGINDAQPLDADLTAIASLAGTSGFLKKTAADTWALDTSTYLTAHPAVAGATSVNNSGITYIQDLTFDTNGHVTGQVSAAIRSGTTAQTGVVQLTDSTTSTSTTTAATPNSVKQAYDLAAAAIPSSEKGAANGVATLDATGRVPSGQLPSYVDDVLEYANLAGFPGTGTTGIIYTALDTNKIYRWSGSAYIEISPSPGSTDAVPEGNTNLYFTNARAQAAVTTITGNAGTATKLATARTIGMTGDVTWTSASFDGSGNVTGTATLANSGVTANTYNNSATAITPITVDAKGRITATGAAVTITPHWNSVTSKPTTLSGYGITDAQSKITDSGLLKGAGAGSISVAVAGTDYVAPSGTFYIGTTSVAHNRTSGALSLTGVNIDGDAGSVDGKSFGAFTAAGGILYATSTTAAAAIGAGTAGQVLTSGGAGAPTWTTISGGATLANDTSTNATYYPTFATATSGNMTTAKVSNTKLTFNPSTGTFSATAFNALSDARYKEDIAVINDSIDKLSDLNGYTFKYTEEGTRSVGLLTQEVEKVLPELVDTNEELDKQTLNYNGIIALLVQGFNEHRKQYENEIAALHAEIAAIRNQLN